MEQRSHRLLLLFAVTTIVPAVGLAWLGWRLVDQDRALERQRVQERRDHAADLAAAVLERKIGLLEDSLSKAASQGVPDGAAVVVLRRDGVAERWGVLLPYVPLSSGGSAPFVFARADELEFRGDAADAIGILRELARRGEPPVRGEAWLRLSRIYRKRGDTDDALRSLAELSKLDNVVINGVAAGLLAAQGRALLLESLGRHGELREAAARLGGELSSGRWLVSRTTHAFAMEQVGRWWGGGVIEVDTDRTVLAEAVESVWREWPASQLRRTFWNGQRGVLVVAKPAGDRLVVGVAGERFLRREWLAELEKLRAPSNVAFALTDSEGHVLWGSADKGPQSLRIASAWTVRATSGADAATGRDRSPMLVAAVLLMGTLILGGGYMIYRAVSRELHVATLQSDFVAAVSHEFRTPLTTIRQMSEMLVQDRVSSEERRRQFYGVLLRESDRLHRLVDGLLNFGRMEAGQLQYRFELVDPAVLVRGVVADFRQEAQKAGYEVDLQESGLVTQIRADRESLARVFWNLLENAVKYSPECHTVWVELGGAERRVEVRVKDRGIGIPHVEQREIFRKFVRGAGPKESAIQGTGIGLAIARRIVEAHRGEIQVKSSPGQGSEFTVLLPLAE